MYSMEPLVCNDLLDIIHPEGCCSNPLEMDLCMTRVLQKGEVIDLQKASTSVRLRCPHGGKVDTSRYFLLLVNFLHVKTDAPYESVGWWTRCISLAP